MPQKSISNAAIPAKPIFTSFFIFVWILLLSVFLEFSDSLIDIHFFSVLEGYNESILKLTVYFTSF